MFIKVILVIVSYLLGSIPSALIVGKLWKGIDVRKHGSGNLGATNVLRVLGWGPAILVAIMDVGKGILAVYLAQTFLHNDYLFILLCIIAAVIGHSFPIFAEFKGGRSVGVSFGILFYLFPKSSIIIFVIAIIIVAITQYKSVASITCAVIYPFLLYSIEKPPVEYLTGIILVCIFIIYRHIPNVKRLIKGGEHKISWKIKK
ncbi:glycerol-3-phosphate 1-O-acyltransferase PlsY [Dictyoglomus thermophilum]|uniref:Glycerol-3-phosphate acyltransferase n=1 Tax=Dictyoglomus thermophilum TaxID=14 RepID=A0A7C3KNU2_DICTH|nr:glycerol-3-phosphate 1-O-acyltransferase PlsY [Dictyoglomus thermophilum]TYT22487.1 glycerol-3-phosphate 1-O-acyltransferase PlsY [Dictyoglomus thermophilum]